MDVAIVDDNYLTLKLHESIVKGLGFRAHLFNSGLRFLEVYKSTPIFQLILLDISMEEMSGFEIMRELNKLDLSHKAAVLFVSAKNRPVDKLWAQSLNSNGFIEKPLTPEKLKNAVKVLFPIQKQASL